LSVSIILLSVLGARTFDIDRLGRLDLLLGLLGSVDLDLIGFLGLHVGVLGSVEIDRLGLLGLRLGLLGSVDFKRLGFMGLNVGLLGSVDGQLGLLGLLLSLRETIPFPIGREYQKGWVCCRNSEGLAGQAAKINRMVPSKTSHMCHAGWGRVCLG
jgi:hypothetical protein